jgi:hypothetical protein
MNQEDQHREDGLAQKKAQSPADPDHDEKQDEHEGNSGVQGAGTG